MPLKFNQDQKYCVLPCLKDQKKEKRKKRLRHTYFLLFFNFFPDVVNDNWQRGTRSEIPGHALLFQLLSIAFWYYAATTDRDVFYPFLFGNSPGSRKQCQLRPFRRPHSRPWGVSI